MDLDSEQVTPQMEPILKFKLYLQTFWLWYDELYGFRISSQVDLWLCWTNHYLRTNLPRQAHKLLAVWMWTYYEWLKADCTHVLFVIYYVFMYLCFHWFVVNKARHTKNMIFIKRLQQTNYANLQWLKIWVSQQANILVFWKRKREFIGFSICLCVFWVSTSMFTPLHF